MTLGIIVGVIIVASTVMADDLLKQIQEFFEGQIVIISCLLTHQILILHHLLGFRRSETNGTIHHSHLIRYGCKCLEPSVRAHCFVAKASTGARVQPRFCPTKYIYHPLGWPRRDIVDFPDGCATFPHLQRASTTMATRRHWFGRWNNHCWDETDFLSHEGLDDGDATDD